MNTLSLNPDGQFTPLTMAVPQVPDGGILVKTLACGVCGTDVLKVVNRLVTKPTVLGHELVGTVSSISKSVTNFAVGDRIVAAHHVPCFKCRYCRHGNISMCAAFKTSNFVPGGFAEYVALSAEHLQYTTFKIPDSLPTEEALFLEPLACCVRNLDRLPLLSGDTIIVVGLGSIGLMTAALLHLRGCKVIGLDLDSTRREQAKLFGIDKAQERFDSSLYDKDSLPDGVILTAGPAQLVSQSMEWVRSGGFVNLFSHLEGEEVKLDSSAIYHRELTLNASYSASPDALREAFKILSTDNLKLRRLLAAPYTLLDLPKAIDDVIARRVFKAAIMF